MLKPLGETLSGASDALGAARHLRRHRVREAWREVVGELLAHHSEPVSVRGDLLLVRTTAAAWSQEILFGQQEILQRLRRLLGDGRIKQIRCTVGQVRPAPAGEEPQQARIDWASIPVEPARAARIKALAGEVADPELRQGLERLLTLLARRDRLEADRGRLPCPDCGRYRDPRDELCPMCRLERERARKERLLQTIGRQPWLGLRDLLLQFPDLTRVEFHEIRRQLRSILLRNVWNGYGQTPDHEPLPSSLRTAMVELATLATGLAFDRLTPRHMRYALGKTMARAYLENRKIPKEQRS